MLRKQCLIWSCLRLISKKVSMWNDIGWAIEEEIQEGQESQQEAKESSIRQDG